jgi:hypothetical protein
MQTVQRTIVSVKPGQSPLGTTWSDVVGLPAGTKLDLVKVDDKAWTVEFPSDMLDLQGVMHKAGERMTVNSKALILEP